MHSLAPTSVARRSQPGLQGHDRWLCAHRRSGVGVMYKAELGVLSVVQR
jgi:hypothetical protein